MSLLPIAIGLSVAAGIGVLIHHLFNKNNKTYCHALYYEKIGDQEVYKGLKRVFKVETNAVTCLKIQGEPNSHIDIPEHNDFFPVKMKGVDKILHVVKFGERDYRVKKKFDETWFKKVALPVYEEFVDTNEEGEEFITKRIKTIKGQPVVETIEEQYKEPLGITQKGMDAIRAGLQNERELNKELASSTFWDKYGTSMVFIAGLMIVALMVIKGTENVSDATAGLVETCAEAAKDAEAAAKKVDEPHWAENVLDYMNNKNNAPPTPPN